MSADAPRQRTSLHRVDGRAAAVTGARVAEEAGSGGSGRRFVTLAEGVTLHLADCRDVQLAAEVLISDPPYGTGKYEHDDDASVVQILRAWPRKAVFGYPETLCEWAASLGKPDEWVTWWPTNKQIRRIGKLTSEQEAIAIWGETYEVPMRPRAADKFARRIAESRGLSSEEAKAGDVWCDPSPGMLSNHHLRQHPNEKPESLMAKLVKLCSLEGETVCDPYMGSGTTGVVAVRYGRRFVGVEKDPAHFETAVRRIRAELAQGVLPLGGGGAEQACDGTGETQNRVGSPIDPKLSDRGVRRGTCMVGGKAAAEAGAVTHGAVRCSAWLGDG